MAKGLTDSLNQLIVDETTSDDTSGGIFMYSKLMLIINVTTTLGDGN